MTRGPTLKSLLKADGGVAIVEFALLLPLLVLGFLGTIEMTALLAAQSRVTWTAGCMADNIARYYTSLGGTLKNSELQAMGQGAVAMLSPSDDSNYSNIATSDVYMGAMMLVRNLAGTAVIPHSTWSVTTPALRVAYQGASSTPIPTSEMSTIYTTAFPLTDSTSGVVYVGIRYNYKSMFDLFFTTMNLKSDAFAKQRWGVNVPLDPNN